MEKTECSEKSTYKIQTPGNYPEENVQHTEHGESLKSRIDILSKKKYATIGHSNMAFQNSIPLRVLFLMQGDQNVSVHLMILL
jgi:hypothetical protein